MANRYAGLAYTGPDLRFRIPRFSESSAKLYESLSTYLRGPGVVTKHLSAGNEEYRKEGLFLADCNVLHHYVSEYLNDRFR